MSPSHRTLSNPVFLQKIFPYASKSFIQPFRFLFVAPAWRETMVYYSGLEICFTTVFLQKTAEKKEDRSASFTSTVSDIMRCCCQNCEDVDDEMMFIVRTIFTLCCQSSVFVFDADDEVHQLSVSIILNVDNVDTLLLHSPQSNDARISVEFVNILFSTATTLMSKTTSESHQKHHAMIEEVFEKTLGWQNRALLVSVAVSETDETVVPTLRAFIDGVKSAFGTEFFVTTQLEKSDMFRFNAFSEMCQSCTNIDVFSLIVEEYRKVDSYSYRKKDDDASSAALAGTTSSASSPSPPPASNLRKQLEHLANSAERTSALHLCLGGRASPEIIVAVIAIYREVYSNDNDEVLRHHFLELRQRLQKLNTFHSFCSGSSFSSDYSLKAQVVFRTIMKFDKNDGSTDLLKEQLCDVRCGDKNDKTALMTACYFNYNEKPQVAVIGALLEKMEEIGGTELLREQLCAVDEHLSYREPNEQDINNGAQKEANGLVEYHDGFTPLRCLFHNVNRTVESAMFLIVAYLVRLNLFHQQFAQLDGIGRRALEEKGIVVINFDSDKKWLASKEPPVLGERFLEYFEALKTQKKW